MNISWKKMGMFWNRISKSGLEVDRAKVEVIAKLPYPITFNLEIRDKKGAENVAADHLSRLENPHKNELEKQNITESFPLESLGKVEEVKEINVNDNVLNENENVVENNVLNNVNMLSDNTTPWFADLANYHAGVKVSQYQADTRDNGLSIVINIVLLFCVRLFAEYLSCSLQLNAVSGSVHSGVMMYRRDALSVAQVGEIGRGGVDWGLLGGDGPLEYVTKAMACVSVVASRYPSIKNQLRTSSNPINQATIQDGPVRNNAVGQGEMRALVSSVTTVKMLLVQETGENGQVLDEEQLAFLEDIEDLDAYDLDCDDVSTAKAVMMANLSSLSSDVLSEVPIIQAYQPELSNDYVQEMQYSEEPLIVESTDTEINSDSNIIPYSQYLLETQSAGLQDTNSSEQHDLLIMSLVEQMNLKADLDKHNQQTQVVNESLTAELERYKERIKQFEQRQNVDLSEREKLIDSQMDAMIRDRNAKFVSFQTEIETLKTASVKAY
ncbi:hypothetical protein Tco_0748644 [Tanacetum coccineum]|uniref:Uncharacterized protein n=1 Tax=Tanacetum coccineum TaxID=301880 RepID=A0ABQ4YZL6_9ASTR